jgi:hypothetical protein
MPNQTNDHEIVIGSTTTRLQLMRDTSGKALYQVQEKVPKYEDPLLFTQKTWVGGHGQLTQEKEGYYLEGQSIDTTQEGRVILAPLIVTVQESDDTALDSAPVGFCWFPAVSKWLCYTAGKVYLYGTKWTAATTTIAGITDMKVCGAVVYAAVGASTKYYYSADGDTWTQSALDDGYANKFLVAPNSAGTADILWKSKNPNEVTYTTDGTSVAWSTATYVGDTSTNIINMFLCNDRLFVGKTNSLWYLDAGGGTHNIKPDLATSASTDNFKYVTDWQNSVYYTENNRLGEISGYDSYAPMGALYEIDNIGKAGSTVGLTADGDWLYQAVDEGTNTVIYKGHETEVDIDGDGTDELVWQWCPYVFLGTNVCATIGVVQHSATDRRLWFGYGTQTGYVSLYDNPTAESSARYCASGYVRMSYTYGTNPYWDKMWQSIVTETKNCAVGITVTPKYMKDTDTSASALTAAITTNGIVKTNLSSAITCNRICFELDLATNDSTKTPEVLMFQARGVEKPEVVRVHNCTYSIGNKPSLLSKTQRTTLRGARTSTSLIKFADLRYGDTTTSGTSYIWVVAEPGTPTEVEIVHEKGREPELGLQVAWREVSFTVS